MGIIEEIGKMRQNGKSEQEIASYLKQMGLPEEEISNLVTQTQIKEAVSAPPTPIPSQEFQMNQQTEYQTPYFGLNPTTEELNTDLQAQQYSDSIPSENPPQTQEEYPQNQYAPYQDQGYNYPQDQYSQASSISSDMVSEIAEQVVAEKLSKIRDKLEKTLELKTTIETKLSILDERLQRIEKIIDRLQLSILQKVGEYIINVSDLKKELGETQKSFKSLSQHHIRRQHEENSKHRQKP